MQHIFGKKVNI